MLLVAADHPARGALGVRGAGAAMASRSDLLDRLVTALERPGVDGVLGTPDILDDLLLLGALDGKVAIGSMNRGGLQGASFELDDRFTAYTAAEIAARGIDGGKMLTRICLDDPGTVATLEASAHAVTELAEHRSWRWSSRSSRRARAAGSSTSSTPTRRSSRSTSPPGLGASSAYTWLKLPVVDELDRVMDATTLPTLLLGGDPQGDPQDTYASWGHALDLPAVRGLVVGRALLFPPDGDVAAAVDIAAEARPRERGRARERQRALGAPPRERRHGRVVRRDRRRRRRLVAHAAVCRRPRSRAEPHRRGGRVGARRRAALGLRHRHGGRPRGPRRTRPSWPGRASVFAGPTDVAYATRDCERHGDRRGRPRHESPSAAPARRDGTRRRSATWASRTCPSSCAAPASRPARSATSASPACSTPTRSSPARSSRPAATGAPTRRTSTTRSARASRPSSRRSTTSRSPRPPAAPEAAGASPVGYQRVYGTDERPIDVLAEVRSGDVVLVPHGWHGPAMAAPGYDLYYLNVMAGPGAGAGLAHLRRPRPRLGPRHLVRPAGRPPTSPWRCSMTSDTQQRTADGAPDRGPGRGALPRQPVERARRRAAEALRRLLRHLRPRQRRRHRPGAAAERAAPTARSTFPTSWPATSRRWSTRPSPTPARRTASRRGRAPRPSAPARRTC